MIGAGIIEIDLHGMRIEAAKQKIDGALRTASPSVYRIRLIHGYHRGHGLKDMIRETYGRGASSRVKRVEGGWNEGITELVLREF